MRRALRVSGALSLALLLTMVSACARGADTVATDPLAEENVAAVDPGTVRQLSLDDIRELGMTMAGKRESLPPEFPAPVPVMAGEVSEARANAGVVFYTLRVDVPASVAAEWYVRTYEIANWRTVDEREVDAADGPVRVLAFEKGDGARSDITIRSAGAEEAIVEGTVGLGAPAADV